MPPGPSDQHERHGHQHERHGGESFFFTDDEFNSSRRRVSEIGRRLAANGPDIRFIDDRKVLEAIVTSTAQNDAGLFEPSMRDERYLPFQGAGAISTWDSSLRSGWRLSHTGPSNGSLHGIC